MARAFCLLTRPRFPPQFRTSVNSAKSSRPETGLALPVFFDQFFGPEQAKNSLGITDPAATDPFDSFYKGHAQRFEEFAFVEFGTSEFELAGKKKIDLFVGVT